MKKVNVLMLVFFTSVLLSSCYDPYYHYDNVEACFSTTKTTYFVGEEITFYNCSDNAESYFWDFGDDETSTLINPLHSYAEVGDYEIKLNTYGRDGKDENYLVISIVSDETPTNLNILVKYFGTDDEVSDCPIDLYDTELDWSNFQNSILSASTGADGIVEFSDLEVKQYWIDAFKSVSDTSYYSNENLGVSTDVLEEGVTNYYDVFVEYLLTASTKKVYVIRKVEKITAEERLHNIEN